MSNRPEILFPIFSEITGLTGVGPGLARKFGAMNIARPRDLLFTLPQGAITRTIRHSVRGATPPEVVTVEVQITQHQPNRQKGRPYRILVEDAQTSFQLVFFHARADWLRKTLPTGQRRLVSGKVEVFDGVAQMVHPDYVLRPEDGEQIPVFEPVYPLTTGLGQKAMTRAVHAAIEKCRPLAEWIEPGLKAEKGWPDWAAAVRQAHEPCNHKDLSPFAAPRERLAYDELLAHQLTLALARAKSHRARGVQSKATGLHQDPVLEALPYKITSAQERVIAEIAADLASNHRMNRLLQGDVGSGKTIVAMMALLIAVEAGGQGVLMAPTEILVRQHLYSLRPLAMRAGVNLDILTGRDAGRDRGKKLKALACGDIQILLGTHAVFQEDVRFRDLRVAVIDEQHRFGVRQRMSLGAKGGAVDVLVMTATPIPRSLALAQYGDMDISVLDEKPVGRKPVQTVVLPTSRRDEVIGRLKRAIAAGQQAYWVCPLVHESEAVDWTAAAERHRVLASVLGADAVGLVHGQMPAIEKDAAMAAFVAGKTSVLVATTVIEVGVDVPNASIMVIEQAEKFGLAQLHQLRGRVGRGSAPSSCLLIYSPPLGKAGDQRLRAMRNSGDGFVLAEEDLRLRGAGDMLGVQQSGLPKFRIADLETQTDQMKTAQQDARMLLNTDPDLKSERGEAARVLLYLMDQDESIRLMTVG